MNQIFHPNPTIIKFKKRSLNFSISFQNQRVKELKFKTIIPPQFTTYLLILPSYKISSPNQTTSPKFMARTNFDSTTARPPPPSTSNRPAHISLRVTQSSHATRVTPLSTIHSSLPPRSWWSGILVGYHFGKSMLRAVSRWKRATHGWKNNIFTRLCTSRGRSRE